MSEEYLFERALHLMDVAGGSKDYDPERAIVYATLGLIAKHENRLADADGMDSLAIQFASQSNRTDMIAELYIGIAVRAFDADRLDDAVSNYDKAMAEMQKDLVRYADQIKATEEILVFLYGRIGRTKERGELRKRLLPKKVAEFMAQRKKAPLPHQPQPEGWAMDNVTNFLEVARRNTEASFVVCPTLCQQLVEKDAHFGMMHEAVKKFFGKRIRSRYPNQDLATLTIADDDWLEGYFFHQAHSSFLGGTRLAMSGQVPQAQMVLRGLLENAMYCFYIHHNQHLKAIWLNRQLDAKSVKDNFLVSKIWDTFKKHAPHLHSRTHSLYNKTVDDGAHPNVNAFTQNAAHVNKDGQVTFSLNYLNPKEVENCLKATICCVDTVLEIFDLVFDTLD